MSSTKLLPPTTNQPLSDALLKAICDSNTIGVQVGRGYEGELLYVNDTFLAMIGYSREEFETGQINWREISPPEDAPIDAIAVNNMKNNKATAPFEKRYIHKDGHLVRLCMQPTLIPGTQSDWICYMVEVSPQ
jgi:PAS domain S-box-containing protein